MTTQSSHILLVEDNPINQKLGTRILEKLGVQVTLAGNGEVAIECLENATFDLILMDIEMPVMNGYETTEKIRQVLSLDIPIVATTGHSAPEDIHKCMEAGMNATIAKPFTGDQVLAVMEKLKIVH